MVTDPEGFDFSHFKQGTSGNDRMVGGSGEDRFDGLAGNDTMIGGNGNDAYIVREVGDEVVENANEGYDAVYSFKTYYMPENVEKLFLTGTIWKTEAQDAFGNSLNNYISANCGSNHICGGGGNDTIFGGGYGKDTIEGNDGNDWMMASRRDCRLYGGSGKDSLVSWFGNDLLCGGSGSDMYKGFTKDTEIQEHGNFIGFYHDTIRDYLNSDESIATIGINDWDQIDLTLFAQNEIKFSAVDSDHNGKIDRLHIDAGKYGSIDIDKYFDDSSSNAAQSGAGIGCIEDIMLANKIHMRFASIQQELGGSVEDPGGDDNDEDNPDDGGEDTVNIVKGTSADNWIKLANENSEVYGYGGKDTIYSGSGDDILCGGQGSDLYRVYTQTWGHDIIRDYMDDGQMVQPGKYDWDRLELTNVNISSTIFSAIDTDNDHYVDRLHIDAGNYGTFDIDKYFDDSSSSIALSKAGIGCIEDIMFANNHHTYFADIQQLV